MARLIGERGITPCLAVVLVGEDAASQVYVRNKGVQTLAACIAFDLLALIATLNADPAVHGIIVQLPLPGHLNPDMVISGIDPAKDVDGFHVSNAELLYTGQKSMVPCTPLGCLMKPRGHDGPMTGLNAVVIGRSNIVGKPTQLLLRESCTVTIAHSRTRELAGLCRRADILVAAMGRPETITGDIVKPGASVIGINRIKCDGRARLVGDVHYESARPGRRRDHTCTRRRGHDDHRLPAGQHVDRLVQDKRTCRA